MKQLRGDGPEAVTNYRDFHERIKDLVIVNTFADRLGRTSSTLRRWTREDRPLNRDDVFDLGKALDRMMEDLAATKRCLAAAEEEI